MTSAARASSLPLETLELVDQLLERWDSLQPANRSRIATSLLIRIQPELAADAASLSEDQLKQMLWFGAVAAGINCSRVGANPPTRAEVDAAVNART